MFILVAFHAPAIFARIFAIGHSSDRDRDREDRATSNLAMQGRNVAVVGFGGCIRQRKCARGEP